MKKPKKKRTFQMDKRRYERASQDAARLAETRSHLADIEQARQMLLHLSPESSVDEHLAFWQAFEQARTHPTLEEIANSPELAQREYWFALAREFLAEKGNEQ